MLKKYISGHDFRNHQTDTKDYIPLGNIDESDALGTALHYAALHGNKRTLKKVLQKGIFVDYPNDESQSPLFCACHGNQEGTVEFLVSSGANPNERSNSGLTPVHVAAFVGNVKLLMCLLNNGGDLRLHDNQGRTVKDWAMFQPDPKRRMKMLEFLDKAKLFAMTSSGQDMLYARASSAKMDRMHGRTHSITKVIRDALGQISGTHLEQRAGVSSHALGFGQVYNGGSNNNGFLSAVPMVSQNSLRHDLNGETYNNGVLFVMERHLQTSSHGSIYSVTKTHFEALFGNGLKVDKVALAETLFPEPASDIQDGWIDNMTKITNSLESMKWDYCNVTVKRMHRESDAHEGGAVDHLINELEFMGKLRHPNILIFMGVCQTTDLEALVLIFERIGEGSLYNHLHEKIEQMSLPAIQDLALQISSAILFIHHQNCIHCSITSHAINIITPSSFKLGNFEHMIERSKCEMGKKSTVASTPQARISWMAPEIIHNLPPTPLSDMYSFCCVLWEIFIGEIPWEPYDDEGIRNKLSKGDTLPLNSGKIPEMFQVILGFGLKVDPNSRKLSFLHVQDLLLAAPEDSKKYIKDHYKNIMMTGSKHDQSSLEADRRLMHTNSTSDTDQIPHISKKHHLDTNLCTTGPAMIPKKTTGSDLNKNNTKYPPAVCRDWTDPKALDGTPDEQTLSCRQPSSSVMCESHCEDGHTQGLNIGIHQKWRRHPDQYEYTVAAHSQALPTKQTRDHLYSDYDSTGKTSSAAETQGHSYKDCHTTGQASSTHETSGHSFSHSNAQIYVTPETRGYSGRGYYTSGQNSAIPGTSGNSYGVSYSTDQQTKYQRTQRDNGKEYVTVSKASRKDLDQDSSAALRTLEGEHRMSASNRTVSKDTSMDQEKGIGHCQNISTAAISKFSYLNLQQKCQTNAKPAGHNTEYFVDEGHTTAGKLTTKGSLYAIYNEYSPEKTYPQPQVTCQAPRSATLPRRSNAKEPSPPLVEIEGGWFGGRGSVRNLVDLFQEQNKEHCFKQTVLEGKLSRSAMHHEEEPLLYSRDQETSQDPNKSKCFGNNCSNLMEKDHEGNLVPEHAEMAQKEQSDEYESSYSFTTVSTSESAERISERYLKDTTSHDSAIVSEWVDKELEKIKRKILKENLKSEDYGFTEDVIIALAQRQESSDSTYQRKVEKKKSKSKFKVKEYKEKVKQIGSQEVEEFYFDDEIHANMGKETHMRLSESFEMLSSKENKARSRKAPNDKLLKDSTYQRKVEKKKSKSKFKVKEYKEKVKQIGSQEVEEFYFDDEIHANMGKETHMRLSESFEMLSSKENKARSRKAPNDKLLKGMPQQRKENRRTSKIPVVKGTSTSKNNEGSYENIYTLRSSLSNIGQHTLTHSLKDLSTGEICTVAHETFEADKVITNFIGD